MSLINDALKQASRVPQASSLGAAGGSNSLLRPVEAPRSSGRMSFLLPLVLAVVLAGAGWFLWQWWQTGKVDTSSLNISRLMHSARSLIPGGKPATDVKPDGNSTTSSATTTPENGKGEGNFMTQFFNKQLSGTDSANGAAFPPIKVQGIYYRTGDSSVLINGKNLSEGEAIEGVKIAKIDRQSVTLQFHGQTKEITLR